MTSIATTSLNKVPAVTLGFWIVKIAATTLGETAGDAVSMSMNLGYAVSSIVFIGIFAAAGAAQIRARSFHPFLYWAVIVATTRRAPPWRISRTVRSASVMRAALLSCSCC